MSKVAYIASILLPFFNLPLIYRLVQRKSSDDVSLTWAAGVWICIVLMAPRLLWSGDPALRVFGYLNTALFTCVAVLVFWYRYRRRRPE